MYIPLSLLVLHFVGDFVLQSNWMALNKSRRLDALFAHAITYSLMFLPYGLEFVAITFVTHFITDYHTSRLTSKLWFLQMIPNPFRLQMDYFIYNKDGWIYLAKEPDGSKRHWFFVVIGFDQLLHAAQLALTYNWLLQR